MKNKLDIMSPPLYLAGLTTKEGTKVRHPKLALDLLDRCGNLGIFNFNVNGSHREFVEDFLEGPDNRVFIAFGRYCSPSRFKEAIEERGRIATVHYLSRQLLREVTDQKYNRNLQEMRFDYLAGKGTTGFNIDRDRHITENPAHIANIASLPYKEYISMGRPNKIKMKILRDAEFIDVHDENFQYAMERFEEILGSRYPDKSWR